MMLYSVCWKIVRLTHCKLILLLWALSSFLCLKFKMEVLSKLVPRCWEKEITHKLINLL